MGANCRLRALLIAMMTVASLALMAEDVVFMTNRRQWEKLPSRTLLKMGDRFREYDNLPDSALLCYSIVANRYNENLNEQQKKYCVIAHLHTGILYNTNYHDYLKSWINTEEALELATKIHYDSIIPVIYNKFGTSSRLEYEWTGNEQRYKDALSYYKNGFKQSLEMKQWYYMQSLVINLIVITFDKDSIGDAIDVLNTYQRLSIPDTVPMRPFAKALCEGMLAYHDHDIEKALAIFRSLPIDNNLDIYNQKSHQVIANDVTFSMLLQMGRYDEAKKVIEQTRTLGDELISGVYEQYMLLYQHMNNQALADKYELLWRQTSDSLAREYQVVNLEDARFIREIEKMNEQQKELTLKQQHDRQLLWIVGGFLVLATVLLILLAIGYRRTKRNNLLLYENNLALLAAEEQRRKLAEEQEQIRIKTEADKYGATKLDEQTTEELWQNIVHVMEYSQEIYDTSFCLTRLAELVGTKPNYVSQAINQQDEWSFPTLLSHYRINEACRRINDISNYGNYTVEGIGQSVGFKSRSHFVKTFKKQTGLSPSDYQKLAHSKSEA